MKFTITLLAIMTLMPPIVEGSENSFTRTFDSKLVKSIHIENPRGQILIQGQSGNEYTVNAVRIDGDCRIEIEQHRHTLEVEVDDNRNKLEDCAYNISITTPKQVDEIEIKLGTGNVMIKNIETNLETKIGSGDILFEAVKLTKLEGKAGMGGISGTLSSDHLDLKLANGDIDIQGNNKKINIKMGNGTAKLKGTVEKVDIKAGNVKVDLDLDRLVGQSTAFIKAANGDVSLWVPQESEIQRSDSTMNREVRIQDKENGALHVKLKSFSGEIHVHER